jgi:hypothetical protein
MTTLDKTLAYQLGHERYYLTANLAVLAPGDFCDPPGASTFGAAASVRAGSTSGEVSSPRGSHRADRPGPSSEPVLGRIAGTIKDLPAAELSRLVLPLAGTCGKSSSTW